MPSGRMSGDRVAGNSRKYLASQTFTASYPALDKQNQIGSILLWILVFRCKFTGSYFFLTTSFGKPIQVMVGMKIQGCMDRFFLNALCTNQAAFTLMIMYVMDLVLFSWAPSCGISFGTRYLVLRGRLLLAFRFWTPWKDIYTQLPKRIYAKLLATRSSTSPR